MQFYFSFLICVVFQQFVFGQITGNVRDESNVSLPYASVYVAGTTIGTTTNAEGYYELQLRPGKYTIVVQYLGYESYSKEIDYQRGPIELNAQLSPSRIFLNEIVISSNQKDPAYEIIQQAINKRKYYEKNMPAYKNKAYTKGLMRILDAPTKILGRDIGNMDGNLDSNRQGIVYLSESVSEITFQPPSSFVEKMISSKVSGNDNGFSFNRASAMNINLYQNTSTFGRQIISPIADFAFGHYRYILLGTEMNSLGNKIFKIQMIPKIEEDAVWNGIIYILDSSWTIYAFDGYVRGSQIKQHIFDTIRINQIYFPVRDPDVWSVQRQLFTFNGGIFNIKVEGDFSVVFSDFDFNDTEIVHPQELLKIEKGANEKTKLYWDSIRPIPLTLEEEGDYSKKESLRIVRESKSYRDSMDRKNNAFNFADVLTGYTFENTDQRMDWTLASPLNDFTFNPVQGWALGTAIRFNKYLHKTSWYNRFSMQTDIQYGFSDENWRGGLETLWRYDRKNNAMIKLKYSNRLTEFNNNSAISGIYNGVACLFWKNNQLKLFENNRISIEWAKYLSFDFKLHLHTEFQRRENVENTSNYSFLKKHLEYSPNNISGNSDLPLHIQEKNLILVGFTLHYLPKTKVWILPDEISRLGSSWPEFRLKYAYNYYFDSKKIFHKYAVGITKNWQISRWGNLAIQSTFQHILSENSVDVPDRIFQKSVGMLFYNVPEEGDYFLSLPLYSNVSSSFVYGAYAEHNFKGILLDRIPWVNRLAFTEIFRAAVVYTPEAKWEGELSVGLGNIGFGVFRLLRLDYVHRIHGNQLGSSYLRIGLNRVLNVGR